MSKLGQLIKEKRNEKGLTQCELTRMMKLKSGQFLSNVERGIAPFPMKHTGVLVAKLGLTRDEIIAAALEDCRSTFMKEIEASAVEVASEQNAAS